MGKSAQDSKPTDNAAVSPGGRLMSFFAGWSLITWFVAILMACGGLLVAFATKHADSVAKTIATSVALVLVVVLEILLLGASADPIVILPALIVLLAMETYREAGRVSKDPPVAVKLPTSPKDSQPIGKAQEESTLMNDDRQVRSS